MNFSGSNYYSNSLITTDFPTPEFPVINVLLSYEIVILDIWLNLTKSEVGTDMLK